MPTPYRFILLPCLCAITVASCITHRPVRTYDSVSQTRMAPPCADSPPAFETTSIAELQAGGAAGDSHRALVACVSEEQHRPIPSGSTAPFPHDGFNLYVFEFDDDGLAWNRERQERSFAAIQNELDTRPAVVLAFVHGWKNDASVCNGNLACFREVLEIVAKTEKAIAGSGTPRRVVGVYIGWRGGTVKGDGFASRMAKQTTFWGRKHTAHVIGDNGGVTALIERLRTIVAQSRFRRGERTIARASFGTTSVVFVGHSFGGALLFSAVATSLNASVGAAIQGRDDPVTVQAQRRPQAQQRVAPPARPVITDRDVFVRSDGDLVILVNPAMEASRFANLANTRNLRFDSRQVPIFLTLASEGDGAVGRFFPIGQAFATVARSARSRQIWFSMEKGFGMYEPFHTHRLVLKPGQSAPGDDAASGTCRCKSNLSAFGDALVTRLRELYQTIPDEATITPADRIRLIEGLDLAGYQETLYTRLEPVRDVDPNNPFLMASVDPKVISGHSAIFNARFIDFLIEYIVRSEIKRSLVGDFGQERR